MTGSSKPLTTTALVFTTVVLSLSLASCRSGASGPSAAAEEVAVTLTGGHDTDARDHGRPVVLVAAALGVPAEVFRTAFSGVTPAGAGQQPGAEQVGSNKAALLSVLAPYGVTNARLDEVSNLYRYNATAGEMWPTRTATAVAMVVGGRVTSIRIIDGGSGYSSTPSVSIPGVAGAVATAHVSYGTDTGGNGSISSISVTTA
ncbi:MAG: hypothetical protein JWO88_421 [Frankiales bacterium]|nr:hypothetical protein [Frankiales bacterium]